MAFSSTVTKRPIKGPWAVIIRNGEKKMAFQKGATIHPAIFTIIL